MIKSFAEKRTVALFEGKRVRGVTSDIARSAMRKLALLHAASSLDDLGGRRGLRLEKLRGDRAGQWSIRVNAQWRICFHWIDGDAWEVEFTDYH